MWALISWLAVVTGFGSTWVVGRHNFGWILSLVPLALWGAYNVKFGIWAGVFSSAVASVLAVRNWNIGRRRDALSH